MKNKSKPLPQIEVGDVFNAKCKIQNAKLWCPFGTIEIASVGTLRWDSFEQSVKNAGLRVEFLRIYI
jgi:hypothetical protein